MANTLGRHLNSCPRDVQSPDPRVRAIHLGHRGRSLHSAATADDDSACVALLVGTSSVVLARSATTQPCPDVDRYG